ncbi:MAG: 2-oxoacid:ferredoxin oxidoreductase subunit beta, partial [Odoribacter laneus]
GEPMIFGKNKDKGLVFDKSGKLKVVEIGKDGITENDILVHDAHDPNPFLHWMLVNMKAPEFPVALGVIRDVEAHTYDEALDEQIEEVKKISKIHCMDDLLNSGDIWEVK